MKNASVELVVSAAKSSLVMVATWPRSSLQLLSVTSIVLVIKGLPFFETELVETEVAPEVAADQFDAEPFEAEPWLAVEPLLLELGASATVLGVLAPRLKFKKPPTAIAKNTMKIIA